MKATQRDFASVAPRAAQRCAIFFFCGPDEAGASEAAARIIAMRPDAGERVELAGGELRKDPVRLDDEARSASLFGDRRHIVVRAAGDEALEALRNLAESRDNGAHDTWPVFVIATSATDKSRSAKLLEKREDALVAMFWPPDLATITAAVRAMGDQAGLRLGGDMAERIARAVALDLRLARLEVEKIALYLDASPQSPRSVDAETLDAIGSKTEEDGFMPLVNAVLSGETGKLAGELRRMQEMSINPVAITLALERRAAQLVRLAALVGARGNIRSVLKQEIKARRVFFRDERDLEAQLRRWGGARLERLVEKLVELHQALLANSQAAELLLAQSLTQISRAAARG